MDLVRMPLTIFGSIFKLKNCIQLVGALLMDIHSNHPQVGFIICRSIYRLHICPLIPGLKGPRVFNPICPNVPF